MFRFWKNTTAGLTTGVWYQSGSRFLLRRYQRQRQQRQQRQQQRLAAAFFARSEVRSDLISRTAFGFVCVAELVMGISSPSCLGSRSSSAFGSAQPGREALPCLTPAREHLSRRSGKFRINDGLMRARAMPESQRTRTHSSLNCLLRWICHAPNSSEVAIKNTAAAVRATAAAVGLTTF